MNKFKNNQSILEEDFRYILASELPWKNLASSTILICGANGYISKYFIDFLIFLNDQKLFTPFHIIALVRSSQKARQFFSSYIKRNDFEIVVHDISNKINLNRTIDYIIHGASQSQPKKYNIDPLGSIKPNVIGTWNLLELAHQSQCRSFLFLSSGEVYGKFKANFTEKIQESMFGVLDPLDLRACYSESKRAAETICRAWFLQHGAPIKIARLGHNYGPGMDLEDGRVFASFTKNIVRNENITLESSGSESRPFCYLSDTITGLLTLLFKGNDGEAYNLANTNAKVKIIDLAEILCGLFPQKKLKVLKSTSSHVNKDETLWNTNIELDIGKISQLGWVPYVGLGDGFKRTVESYQS